MNNSPNRSATATVASVPFNPASSLQQLAFENSLQPQLVSNSNGRIILSNKAACDLLGYTARQLLSKRRASLFELSESGLKEALLLQGADPAHMPIAVTIVRQNGHALACEMLSVPFVSSEGNSCMLLGLTDMTRVIHRQHQIDTGKEKVVTENIALAKAVQKIIDIKKEKKVVDDIIIALAKSDARLAENDEWKKHIGLTSYDVMWDWEVGQEDVYVSDSIHEVFGYTVENNQVAFSEFMDCILPADRKTVKSKLARALSSRKTTWNESFMFRFNDGTYAATASRASIVRDSNGKAIRLIGAIQDISQIQKLEDKLKDQIAVQEELSEMFVVASKLSFDGRWDWNLITNDFYLGEGFKELFGYAATNGHGKIGRDWGKYIHPEDRKEVELALKTAIDSDATEWEQAYRFIKADGAIARVINRASIIRDTEGKASRIIGAMRDMSQQINLEERFDREMLTKDKQIEDAAEEAKEAERSDIGKELHDNVNQLLSISKLYMDMAKRGGKDGPGFLDRSLQYTSTAIEEIRKLTKGLTSDVIQHLGLCHAIEKVSSETMHAYPVKISCSLTRFAEESIGDKFKLNLFRIVQEQLNNILKHAQAKKISIKLFQNKEQLVLAISDDGVGFDITSKRNGIGLENIKSRAASYKGTAEFISTPGKGCKLVSTFPLELTAQTELG